MIASIPGLALIDSRRTHRITSLPVLVIFPHNRCNCRCLMCDIWKIRDARDFTRADLDRQLDGLRTLGTKWIVFSGGEPQLHSDLGSLAEPIREAGIRLTLLTAGLLLEPFAAQVAAWFDDVIVSLDGPPEIHNAIRRIPGAFERTSAGIRAVRSIRPDMPISARCTVQRSNRSALIRTVQAIRELQLSSVSFLAADLTSSAFNRPAGLNQIQERTVAMNEKEVEQLHEEMEALIEFRAADIKSGFVAENPAKLRRIVSHFRASLGQCESVAPRCNAPWVSSVVESDGTVRPCFFQPSIGNLRDGALAQILNGDVALAFRTRLDVASNAICRSCVCSLYVAPERTGSGDGN